VKTRPKTSENKDKQSTLLNKSIQQQLTQYQILHKQLTQNHSEAVMQPQKYEGYKAKEESKSQKNVPKIMMD
jgi:hypothetical protein